MTDLLCRVLMVVHQQVVAVRWYGTVRGAAGQRHVRKPTVEGQRQPLHHHYFVSTIFAKSAHGSLNLDSVMFLNVTHYSTLLPNVKRYKLDRVVDNTHKTPFLPIA